MAYITKNGRRYQYPRSGMPDMTWMGYIVVFMLLIMFMYVTHIIVSSANDRMVIQSTTADSVSTETQVIMPAENNLIGY